MHKKPHAAVRLLRNLSIIMLGAAIQSECVCDLWTDDRLSVRCSDSITGVSTSMIGSNVTAYIIECRGRLLIGRRAVHVGEIEDNTDSGGLSIPGKWFRWRGLRGCSQCEITEDGECIHVPLTLERRRTTGRLGDGEMRYVPATGGGANQSNALGLPPNSPIAESTVVEARTTSDVKLRPSAGGGCYHFK
jgi:hypothetical protein